MKTANPLRSIVVVKEGQENKDFKMALAAWDKKLSVGRCYTHNLRCRSYTLRAISPSQSMHLILE